MQKKKKKEKKKQKIKRMKNKAKLITTINYQLQQMFVVYAVGVR